MTTSVAIPTAQKKFKLKNTAQKNSLIRSTVRELLVQKFISGQTSILKDLCIPCGTIEDLKVEKYDDELLQLLSEELQKSCPAPNKSLRIALMKARFSDTIVNVGGGDVAEPSRKRKRVEDILQLERKKRREEEELRNIELRLQKEKEEKEKRDMREAAKAELEKIEAAVQVNWPEDNFRVMKDFDLLIRGCC